MEGITAQSIAYNAFVRAIAGVLGGVVGDAVRGGLVGGAEVGVGATRDIHDDPNFGKPPENNLEFPCKTCDPISDKSVMEAIPYDGVPSYEKEPILVLGRRQAIVDWFAELSLTVL